ncbi:uncharacterized protein LOC117103477 [Anneissia japonica]|uniref:uncharacterized protein LOC117103477 n=1 Tax=Anneissia japonica TaxID=1529436 RepID=UPI00142559A7|nr:uncharacterized protein LOC117103477 [Anneissia japonica]
MAKFTCKFTAPRLELNSDRPSDFKIWQQQWASYVSVSALDKEPPAFQVNVLQMCMSTDTLRIVLNLGLTEKHLAESCSEIIKAMDAYIQGQVNESVERKEFRTRKQGLDEDFKDFLVSLRDLVAECNFCNAKCVAKAIRDQIIEGLYDSTVIEKLLAVHDLSLTNTLEMVRALASVKDHTAAIVKTPSSAANKRPPKPTSEKTAKSVDKTAKSHGKTHHPSNTQNQKCYYCGHTHVQCKRNCPAAHSTCNNCKKIGHFASVCNFRKLQSRAVHVNSVIIESAPRATITLHHNNLPVEIVILPDSGSDIMPCSFESPRQH